MSPAPGNRVVVAGAGTGKTHALVLRYLEALLGLEDGSDDEVEGERGPRKPERILAITFTDKAASEMRARIQRRLAALLFAVRSGDAAGLDPVEVALMARAHQRAVALGVPVLEALRRSLATAPILTFHAFCARLLREHAIAAGLDPAFELLEPGEERRLLAETAEAAVLDALADPRRGPVVAELCARIGLRGFGERKGLVECLVGVHQTLAERGLAAEALPLAVEPERAVAQVEEALVALAAAIDAVPAATALAAERVARGREGLAAVRAAWLGRRIDGGRVDGSPEPGGGDDAEEGDAEARLASAFQTLQGAVAGGWGGARVADARKALVASVDALGATLVDAWTAELPAAVRTLVSELSARAEREKDARGVLGFGDLLLQARRLLLQAPAVRTRVKRRFDRVLVDEYQDTSPAQEDILALLLEDTRESVVIPTGARPLEIVAPGPGRTFLVGDAKQSIYGFRGADPTVLLRALERVGAREELSVSRRSTRPVVELANLVAEHALPLGALGTDRAALVPLSAARGGEGPAGAHWTVDADSAPPQLLDLPTDEAEAALVALHLRALLARETRKPRDVCVLVRRSRAATSMARALAAARIPSLVVGGDGFFQRPEVSDLISALALALDPTDELALVTVLRSPLAAVPDDQLLALYEALPGKARGLTWRRARVAAESPLVDPSVRERLRAFDEVLELARARLHHEPLCRALDALVEEGGYGACCAVEDDARLRLANVGKLRALCEVRDESAVVVLLRLVESLDELPQEGLATLDEAEEGDADGAVRIMTIHQAKGLEFPVVVLADASSGLRAESDDVLFDVDAGLAVTARGRPIAACEPDAPKDGARLTAMQRVRQRLRQRGEAELARLLYVALTRARDQVFVVGGARRAFSMHTLLGVVRTLAPDAMAALLPLQPVPSVPTASDGDAPRS